MKLNLTTLPLSKLQAIADALAPFEVRLVGGALRDLVAGLPAGDVDLCTTATPDEIIASCQKAGFRFEPTGLEHGTITIIIDGVGFETTSLRRDVATDGRRATVAFTHDFAEDAARRDFTINALYASLDGNLYDPTGGLDDIKTGTLRFIGHPADRIREDYLRILRFYRFYARFGHRVPDAETLTALDDLAPHITTLPKERIHPEVMKLLAAENPLPALQLMAEESSLLQRLGLAEVNLDALHQHQKIFGTAPATERLACLLWSTDIPATLQASHLNPTNRELNTLLALQRGKAINWGSDVISWAYRVGYTLAPLQLRCRAAHGQLPVTATQAALATINGTPAPVFPVTGDDLIAAGLTPGPHLGKTLKQLEDWWLDNNRPAREACLHRLHEIL